MFLATTIVIQAGQDNAKTQVEERAQLVTDTQEDTVVLTKKHFEMIILVH